MNGHTRKQCVVVVAMFLGTLSGCGVAVPAFMAYEASQGLNDAEPSDFYGALPALADVNTAGPILDMAPEIQAQRGNSSADGQYMGAIRPAMALVESVTAHAEPSINGNVATWESIPGMTTGNVWRFVARKVGPNAWDYALMGKDKTAPDAAFLLVFSGHTERNGSDVSGSMSLDWDAAQTLPEHGPSTGQASTGALDVTFSRTADTHSVDMAGFYVGDAIKGRTVDLSMHYVRNIGHGGEMTTKQESWTGAYLSRQRWDATGAARTDYVALRPNLPTVYTSSCADSSGNGVFQVSSERTRPDLGTENLCPFGVAAFYMP